jgi:polysaccharide biosynthesis/export protein
MIIEAGVIRGGLLIPVLIFATMVSAQDASVPAVSSSEAEKKVVPAPSQSSTNSSPGPLLVRDESLYVLSPGDLVEFSVYGVPELTQKVRINGNGDVNLPLVNFIHIGGMRLEDAQAKIEQAYRDGNYIKNSHVTLLVAEYGSGVEVMGEVARPGIYPVFGSRRLFEILTLAGGTTAAAGRNVTIVNRANHTLRTVLLSNDPEKAIEADVQVSQGETIFVSRAGLFYVVGEVLQPSGFVMENKTDYTALRAIAMAHGPTKFARLSGAQIVRKDGDGVTAIPVQLDRIMKSKAPDVKLLPEDIVYVPTNKSKVIGVQATQLAISLATYAAIYHYF